TQILPVDVNSLRAGAHPATLVRVQSGLTIHDLNRALEKKGFALANMGGAEVQTFVGAASTGRHGSGLSFGPLASQIEAIQLLGPGGEMIQLEPANGITDPAKHSGRLLEQPEVNVSLQSNPHLSHAATV